MTESGFYQFIAARVVDMSFHMGMTDQLSKRKSGESRYLWIISKRSIIPIVNSTFSKFKQPQVA